MCYSNVLCTLPRFVYVSEFRFHVFEIPVCYRVACTFELCRSLYPLLYEILKYLSMTCCPTRLESANFLRIQYDETSAEKSATLNDIGGDVTKQRMHYYVVT